MNPRLHPVGRILGIPLPTTRFCLHPAPKRSPEQHVSPTLGNRLHPQGRMMGLMGHLLCHTPPHPPTLHWARPSTSAKSPLQRL